MRLSPIGRATVVTSRAEQYRQLARDCHSLARSLPPGESRVAMQEMAQQWDRLADEQERATDLRQKVLMSDDFSVLDRRDGCPAAYASRRAAFKGCFKTLPLGDRALAHDTFCS